MQPVFDAELIGAFVAIQIAYNKGMIDEKQSFQLMQCFTRTHGIFFDDQAARAIVDGAQYKDYTERLLRANPKVQPASNNSQERIKNLMEISPSYDRGVLEGLRPMTNVFESQWIDALASRQYEITEDVTHIYIAVDPIAGKDRNMYSLMSMVFVNDERIILGAECINACHSLALAQIVVQHIKECRKLKHLADAIPIIALECSLYVVSQQVMADIKRLQADTKFVTPTIQTKLEKIEFLKRCFEKDRIYFAQSFVNAHWDMQQFDDTKAEILRQLRHFRRQRGDDNFVENLLDCCYK